MNEVKTILGRFPTEGDRRALKECLDLDKANTPSDKVSHLMLLAGMSASVMLGVNFQQKMKLQVGNRFLTLSRIFNIV